MEIFSFTLLLKRRSKIWVYLLQKVVDRGSLISLDTARLDEPTVIYLENHSPSQTLTRIHPRCLENAWCVCLITSLFCAASISMLFQFAASLPNLVGIKILKMCHFLVGGLEHVLFFHILGIIIPTGLIFFRGVESTNQFCFAGWPTFCLCIRFANPSGNPMGIKIYPVVFSLHVSVPQGQFHAW